MELGELYEATGRPGLAAQQYAVATASARLAAANGVATDLETALFQADHGSPAVALTAARAEWDRRHSIHTADALGWALHASGQDRAALRYARQANRLGTRDARLLFHLGAIEAALRLPVGGRPPAGRAPARRRREPVARGRDQRAAGRCPMSRLGCAAWSRSSAAALALLVGRAGRRERAPAGQLHGQPLQRRRGVAGVGDGRPRARHRRDPDRAAQPGDRHLRRRHAVPGRAGRVGRDVPARDATRTLRLTVDGSAAALAVRSSAARTLAGQAGLPTLRLECSLSAPASVTSGPVAVRLTDTGVGDEVGWREMTARGDGTTLARSDVPRRTQSARLTAYPKDLLTSPLDVRSLRLSVTPGRAAAGVRTPHARPPRPQALTRGADRLTLAFEGLLTRTEGNPWLGLRRGAGGARARRRARGRARARQDDHGVLPVRPPGGCAALGRDRGRDRDGHPHGRRARCSGCWSAPGPPSCRPGSTPGSASSAASSSSLVGLTLLRRVRPPPPGCTPTAGTPTACSAAAHPHPTTPSRR